MKRTFVGIEISPEARSRASEYTSRLSSSFPQSRVGWERPEKLHITLKFLGPTPEALIPSIGEALQRVADQHEPITISLAGAGVFPPRGNARILWLGLRPGPVLGGLAKAIDSELGKLGFAPETRKFSPHLTIGRMREPRESRDLIAAHLSSDFPEVAFDANEITFFESKLSATGSVYTRLGVFPFGRS